MMKKLFYPSLLGILLILLSSPWKAAAETAEQNVYGIGSVSKMFGAAAIMKLVDQDKVELDTTVTHYLPEFEMADDRYKDITVRMLLNHSSGIMGTTFRNCFLLGDTDSNYHSFFMENLKTQKLKADPGEYSVYCNDGYTLAEIIVESVSGMSFAQFIEREFAIPLGMEHTFMPSDAKEKSSPAPIFYQNRQLSYDNIQSLASGGIYSTAEDLCRFSTIFMNNGAGILSEESVAAMSFPEYQKNRICVLAGDSNFGYGLGWDSVDAYPYSTYGITALTKGGNTGNYNAGIIVLPEQKLSVSVVASGQSNEQCLIMANTLVQEILQEEEASIPDSYSIKNPAVIPEELKKYAGTYASGEFFHLEFTKQNTATITSLENDREMIQEYIYTQDGTFISTDGDYIGFTNLARTENGTSGITGFHFSEEPNGNVYMMGTTYFTNAGKPKSAITMPFAEKIVENTISEKVANVWKKREGVKYYKINDAYNSGLYLTNPYIKISTLKKQNGYTSTSDLAKNCRIIDGDNAVCELDLPVMIGRDLKDYHFYRQDNTEYLDLGGDLCISEQSIKNLPSINHDVTIDTYSLWCKISEEDAGRDIQIRLPENSSYFVYNKDGTCTASSLFQDEKDTILLPENGTIMLAGEKGSALSIEYLN